MYAWKSVDQCDHLNKNMLFGSTCLWYCLSFRFSLVLILTANGSLRLKNIS